MDNPYYKIDFEKVKTIEDIKQILEVLDIRIQPSSPLVEIIKPLLILTTEDNAFFTHIH